MRTFDGMLEQSQRTGSRLAAEEGGVLGAFAYCAASAGHDG
jgi:hypothetical protein